MLKLFPKNAATAEAPIAPEWVELGRNFFLDPRISIDGTVTCSRSLGRPLRDRRFASIESRVRQGQRPPDAYCFYAALQFKVHWRGDRESVEDQASRALTRPASLRVGATEKLVGLLEI